MNVDCFRIMTSTLRTHMSCVVGCCEALRREMQRSCRVCMFAFAYRLFLPPLKGWKHLFLQVAGNKWLFFFLIKSNGVDDFLLQVLMLFWSYVELLGWTRQIHLIDKSCWSKRRWSSTSIKCSPPTRAFFHLLPGKTSSRRLEYQLQNTIKVNNANRHMSHLKPRDIFRK